MCVRPSTGSYASFSLVMGRSPGFGSACTDLYRPLKTWFPFGSGPLVLNLASTGNSPDRSTKSTLSTGHVSVSNSLKTQGFRFSFTPLPGFFSPFLHSTMRYRSLRVFRLGGWSLRLPTGFPVSRGTLVQSCPLPVSPTRLSRSMDKFPKLIRLPFAVLYDCPQPRSACTPVWPVSCSLAATWDIEFSFFSSAYLDVSVQQVSFHTLWIHAWMHEVCSCGFPHSDIHGSMTMYVSPRLFAVNHVLLRLSVPRHPPCALYV